MTGSTRPNNVFILGVAGGSGSGKTYFAKALADALGANATIVYQDNFYIDQSSKFDHDGGSVNFDHPDSLELTLLAKCLSELKAGNTTEIPVYDFKTHTRQKDTLRVNPTTIVIVDGILIYHPDYLRKQFDEMVFFDTPESLRFERRLERDVVERGRTVEGVKAQFLKQVKPMHDEFVEPSKKHAHTVIKDLGDYAEHFEAYKNRLMKLCRV
ncbi:MAG: uridine kinase [Bacteriovoracaceae bacterium]